MISEDDGKQIGLKERLYGAIGTISMQFTPLEIIGPPADKAYAVDPVGVDIRRPSPIVYVKNFPSI